MIALNNAVKVLLTTSVWLFVCEWQVVENKILFLIPPTKPSKNS
jgi:hypothetical protein